MHSELLDERLQRGWDFHLYRNPEVQTDGLPILYYWNWGYDTSNDKNEKER